MISEYVVKYYLILSEIICFICIELLILPSMKDIYDIYELLISLIIITVSTTFISYGWKLSNKTIVIVKRLGIISLCFGFLLGILLKYFFINIFFVKYIDDYSMDTCDNIIILGISIISMLLFILFVKYLSNCLSEGYLLEELDYMSKECFLLLQDWYLS